MYVKEKYQKKAGKHTYANIIFCFTSKVKVMKTKIMINSILIYI